MLADRSFDPWVNTTTRHGLPADEVISALQKEIRRNNPENATLLAYEMCLTGPELEAKLWQRLLVIAVEDIGWGDLQAPVLVHTLFQMHTVFQAGERDRMLFAIHAVRYLCSCLKDRSTDEMLSWIKQGVADGSVTPLVPDYAVDMHTERGRLAGRDHRQFLEEGSLVSPELPSRDETYRQRLLALLMPGQEPASVEEKHDC